MRSDGCGLWDSDGLWVRGDSCWLWWVGGWVPGGGETVDESGLWDSLLGRWTARQENLSIFYEIYKYLFVFFSKTNRQENVKC